MHACHGLGLPCVLQWALPFLHSPLRTAEHTPQGCLLCLWTTACFWSLDHRLLLLAVLQAVGSLHAYVRAWVWHASICVHVCAACGLPDCFSLSPLGPHWCVCVCCEQTSRQLLTEPPWPAYLQVLAGGSLRDGGCGAGRLSRWAALGCGLPCGGVHTEASARYGAQRGRCAWVRVWVRV